MYARYYSCSQSAHLEKREGSFNTRPMFVLNPNSVASIIYALCGSTKKHDESLTTLSDKQLSRALKATHSPAGKRMVFNRTQEIVWDFSSEACADSIRTDVMIHARTLSLKLCGPAAC